MAFDKVVAPLLRVPLFAGLKPLQITEIARQAERIRFRRGDIITKAGAAGDGAYLIVSGEAEVRPEGGSLTFPQPMEPGSLVGELAMLIDHVYGATVVANGRVQCLKLTREAMHDQMRSDPALAEHFTGVINGRLAQVAAELCAIDRVLTGEQAPAASDSIESCEDSQPPAEVAPAATGTDGA